MAKTNDSNSTAPKPFRHLLRTRNICVLWMLRRLVHTSDVTNIASPNLDHHHLATTRKRLKIPASNNDEILEAILQRLTVTLRVMESHKDEYRIAYHWEGVRNHDEMIVALETEDGHLRANAAFEMDDAGLWSICEISGPDNAPLASDSPLKITAESLAEWLSSCEAQFDQTVISIFRDRRAEIMKTIDLSLFDTLAIQTLPAELASLVLNCLPGAGSFSKRVEHAIGKVYRRRRDDDIERNGPEPAVDAGRQHGRPCRTSARQNPGCPARSQHK